MGGLPAHREDRGARAAMGLERTNQQAQIVTAATVTEVTAL